jgi:hypothetical protein
MVSAADFRKRGRDALQSKWPLAIGTGFIACLLGGTDGNVGFSLSSQVPRINDILVPRTYGYVSSYGIDQIILPAFYPLFITGIIWGLVLLVIGGVTTIGYARFNLNLVDGREIAFPQLFSEYTHLFRGFAMLILQGLYILLWTLLLIIPGIIASLSYAMTPYIMAENPDIGANEAIAASKKMMKGQKENLFYLYLTFLGWSLLCLLTLGIGFLWLNPYMKATEAAFYREISGKVTATKSAEIAAPDNDPFVN